MVVALALVAAAMFSTADFLGGIASRRNEVFGVVICSQVAGIVVLAAALPLVRGGHFQAASLAWGAAAGVAGGTGLVLLYAGLSMGRMGLVSPITAVCAAILPVGWSFVAGDQPSTVTLVGAAVGVAAVVLLSRPTRTGAGSGGSGLDGVHRVIETSSVDHTQAPVGRTVLVSLGAGCGFGLFFILLSQAGKHAGLWPIVGARSSSLCWLLLLAIGRSGRVERPRLAWPAVIGAGVLDMAANVGYLLAAQRGQLAVAAVLVSLYPAGTVVLARVLLRELITRWHAFGLALAGVSVVLIALG